MLLLGICLCVCLSACRQGASITEGASGQALLEALKAGDSHKAALLLNEGVYTEVRDDGGDTPFLYAVRTGNTRIVALMLKLGVDQSARCGNSKAALELALDSGNKEMVLCLLEGGVSPDEVGHDSNPLLLKAVKYKEIDTIRLLLKNGVKPSAAGKDGRTALHVAAQDCLQECLNVLIPAGADIDVRDDQGATPLWLAANTSSHGSVEKSQTIKQLLKAGADANLPGPEKQSVLSAVVGRGNYKEAVELVNYGADLEGGKGDELTPIEIAAQSGNHEMVAMLLSRGADGRKVLNDAFEHLDVDLIQILLNAGVVPDNWSIQNESRSDGVVAFCVRAEQLELAKLCLQYGADVEMRGKEGQRPLHMAVAMRDADMCRLLLEHGANPNIHFARPASASFLALTEKESMRWFLRNERRLSPLMMAANNGDLDVISTLLEYGAKKNVYSGKHRLYPVNFASRRSDVKAMQLILGQDPFNEKYYAILDLSDQRVRLYNGKKELVFSSRVSTGKSGFRTPKGTFVITDKHRSHTSTIYGSSMPFFQRLSSSAFGFHSGHCPGYPASHGCIRMPYSAAKKLFGITPVGTRVVIRK